MGKIVKQRSTNMNTLCRKLVPGYHEEEVVEPLIEDKDDYKTEPEKWNTILELCGFNPKDDVSRIVLNISTIEYFVEKAQS